MIAYAQDITIRPDGAHIDTGIAWLDVATFIVVCLIAAYVVIRIKG